MPDPSDDATRYFHHQSDIEELIEMGVLDEDGQLIDINEDAQDE